MDYRDVVIEITRRCNYVCGHCLRGDRQRLDFEPNKLRSLIPELDITSIGTITFSGGEPFLKPEIIIECIEIFREYQIDIQDWFISTNGSILNRKVIEVLHTVHTYCSYPESGYVRVSNSPYHRNTPNYKLRFPKSTSDLIEIIMDYTDFDIDEICELYDYNVLSKIRISVEDQERNSLIRQGYAADVGEREATSMVDDDELAVYINAHGDYIYNLCDLSYETQEKYTRRLASVRE